MVVVVLVVVVVQQLHPLTSPTAEYVASQSSIPAHVQLPGIVPVIDDGIAHGILIVKDRAETLPPPFGSHVSVTARASPQLVVPLQVQVFPDLTNARTCPP